MAHKMRFTSRDHSTVEETWQRFVPSAELRGVDPKSFRFEWRSSEVPALSIVRYELSAEVFSAVEPEDQILVCRVDTKDGSIEGPRGELALDQPWITDGPRIGAHWKQNARVDAFIFGRDDAEELARDISGNDRLRLRVRGASPLSSSSGAHWERTFDYLLASAEALEPEDEILTAGLRRHALWTTLTTFDTSLRDEPSASPQSRPAPAAVRRALDFIDDNAHLPITVDDIAAAAFMSTRGLQYAFRRELDTTPADRLRRVRLEGARREIRAGCKDPIATIARRWGFAHASRFAAAYREAFGRSPAAEAGRRAGS